MSITDAYADEVDLLDSLYEFHPDFIDGLLLSEVEALVTYYGLGSSEPAPFATRDAQGSQPTSELVEAAHASLRKVRQTLGMPPAAI